MTRLRVILIRIAILLLLVSIAPTSVLAISCAEPAVEFSHQFDSGAQWELCWQIDKHSGLTISNVHYGPPAEASTKLLENAALAQILFKYDEDTSAEHILSAHGLGGANHIPPNTSTCTTDIRYNGDSGICTRIRDINTLTTVRRSSSLRRHELSLHALARAGSQTYEQVWRFSEDGQMTPSVRLSGELDRFTLNPKYGSKISATGPMAANASLLFTWRLDFNIGNTPNNDIVEQVDFVPHISNVVRRVINTTQLKVESFRKVNRTQFRGWLVRDEELSAIPGGTTRMGYYLDPQSSGFDYVSRNNNWALFDFTLTKSKPCEQLASGNNVSQPDCGNSLDQFVNAESLDDQDPVVWFSLARALLPKSEDYPAIATREARFTLIPFDWSATTPFTPLSE